MAKIESPGNLVDQALTCLRYLKVMKGGGLNRPNGVVMAVFVMFSLAADIRLNARTKLILEKIFLPRKVWLKSAMCRSG